MDNAQLRVMEKKNNKKIASLDKKNKNYCHFGKRGRYRKTRKFHLLFVTTSKDTKSTKVSFVLCNDIEKHEFPRIGHKFYEMDVIYMFLPFLECDD